MGLSEQEDEPEFFNLDDVSLENAFIGEPRRTHYSNFEEFRETAWDGIHERARVNEAVKSLFMKKQVNKMLELRARVVRQKAKLNMELKMRVAKAKCVYEIWERAQIMADKKVEAEARKHHAQVCSEILQRTNLARCVQDIKHGVYYLRHVPKPVEISPLVMIK